MLPYKSLVCAPPLDQVTAAFPQSQRVFRPGCVNAHGDDATVAASLHSIKHQHRQVDVVERRCPPIRPSIRGGDRDRR